MANVSQLLPHAAYNPELPLEQKLVIARQRLEAFVENGKASATPVLQKIMSEVPEDSVVKASALRFGASDALGVWMRSEGGELPVSYLHPHAFAQVTERAGIPRSYAESLMVTGQDEGARWRRQLLEHILHEHHTHSNSRYLVRKVGSEVRGVLSDKYRRLDSRPLLESFVAACNSVGALPVDGVASDLRVSVRAIIPRVIEPVPGEAMVVGVSFNNSDFGKGTFDIQAFCYRLLCLNGVVGESGMKQIHLGRRLDDNLEFSQRTYELDTRTMASATGDVVRGLLGEKAIESRMDRIRDAHAKSTTFDAAWRRVGVDLTKTEQARVKEAFESPDVVNLPPGQTSWRFSNALSWIANAADVTPERRIELQAAAGKAIAA